jgi:Fe2+ transport system protein B
MTQLTNFQFISLLLTIAATILGTVALFLKAFKSGKRKECIEKFDQLEADMKKEDEKRQRQDIAQERSAQKFEFIERELRDIKSQQNSMSNKIDKLFEIISKLPKRRENSGQEE